MTRAIATMLSAPDVQGPNHGSVIATVDGERWIVDASILSGEPIRISAQVDAAEVGPLPRFEWLDDNPSVVWRTLSAPDGFRCRIDRIGADAVEWDALHQRTGTWSPFNHQLSVRVMRGDASVGVSAGQRFSFDPTGSLSASQLERDRRVRFLVEEIGISEEIAARVPDDGPVPPRPEGR